MAKINRFNGNLAAPASAALGTERTIFGDVTQSDDLTDQFTADLLRGWAIVGPSDQPTLQDFNAMGFTLGQIHAYLHQIGLPEYNAAQEYHIDSMANEGGVIYVSLVDNNVGNTPSSSPSQWRELYSTDADIVSVASASDIDLTTLAPNTRKIRITGSVTINSFTILSGQQYTVVFDSSPSIVNSASIVTGSGANISASSGSSCTIRATASNVVEVLGYTRGAISQNKTSSGYRVLHDGTDTPIIVQWSTVTTSAAGYATATFPIAFPNAFLGIALGQGGTSNTTVTALVNHPAATTVSVPIASSAGNAYVASTVRYIVIGN